MDVYLVEAVERHPSTDTAFVEEGQSFDWAHVRQRAGDVRSHLTEVGVAPGDRVAIAASSEYEFVYALLGALGVGAIVVPTNPMSPGPELIRMLGPLEPSMILSSPMARSMLDYGHDAPAPVFDIASIRERSTAEHPAVVRRDEDETALLMMTSGTSGPAKAAMLSHANLTWSLANMCDKNPAGMQADDVVLCALPTAHVFGLMVITAVIRQGALGILRSRFEAAATLDLINNHGVTLLGGAPLMWHRWSADPGAPAKMTSVTRALSGAAALPLEVHEAVLDRFSLQICEGYGLTETSAIVATSLGQPDVKPTSVGRPVPGVEVVLVEPDGTPVEPGDTGEIVVRGPGIFQGYWNDPDATDEVRTADGWLWTGDGGAFDADGNLFIVDRLKDVIIVSGFNVYPAEVEEVLREHPRVASAAVVGSAHDERGETVAAWVVGDADEASLRSWAEGQLASYKRPTDYYLVDELPLTITGKVMRRELR